MTVPTRVSKALKTSYSGFLDFVASSWKLVSLGTVGLALLVVASILALPPQYHKEISISITPRLTDLQRSLGQKKATPVDEVSNGAVSAVREDRLGEVEVAPSYDATRRTVDVSLHSSDPGALKKAPTAIVDNLKSRSQADYEKDLGAVLGTALTEQERNVQKYRNALGDLDRRIAEASASGAVGVGELEGRRQETAAVLAAQEDAQASLLKAREDLPRIAGQTVSVRLAKESGVEHYGSLPRTLAAAVPFSLFASVAGMLWLKGRGKGRR